MSRTPVPPDGTHVANTRPLLGEFVTVTVCSPVRELAAVTQSVWPFEVPQLLAACAETGTRTVAAASSEKTPSHASGLRGATITIHPDRLGRARLRMAGTRRLPPCLAATQGCKHKGKLTRRRALVHCTVGPRP